MAEVTLRDLARELEITPAAVSMALKGAPNISRDRVKQVQALANKRGYRPNMMARSLREQATKLVGFVLPDFGYSAESEIFAGSKSILSADDYLTLISLCHWDRAEEKREIDLMMQRRVEGLICQPLFGNEAAYQPVLDARLPLVVIGEMMNLPPHNFVQGDDDHAMRMIVKHLVELGHRRIAFLAPDVVNESASLKIRLDAYRAALCKHDLSTDDDLLALGKLADEESIHQATEDLMSIADPPTAIIPIVDVIAYQAMDQLMRMGLSVPGDVSLASIGNFSTSAYRMISLTSVGFDFHRMGKVAGQMLLRQVQRKNDPPLQRKLRGELIVRHSTGPVPVPGRSAPAASSPLSGSTP